MKAFTIIFLFVSEFIFSQSYIQQDTIAETTIKKNIFKKFEEFSKNNFQKKENINIFLIYWMECSIDSLNDNGRELTAKIIYKNLSFKVTNNLKKKDLHYLFSGLIFDNQEKLIASYNETKEVLFPSIYNRALFQAIKKNKIKFVFQIFNLKFNNDIYFLIDNRNRIYIYDSFFTKDKKLLYKVIPFSEYTKPLVLE